MLFAATTLLIGCQQAGPSGVEYEDRELGFYATFPSEPSVHTEQGDIEGNPSTTSRVYGEAFKSITMVTVIDGWSNIAIVPDETWKDVLSDMLEKRYREAVGVASASPAIEFDILDGNVAASTVFPWVDDTGETAWVFYTMLFRDDNRFYEYTGSRPRESEANAALASFGLVPSSSNGANSMGAPASIPLDPRWPTTNTALLDVPENDRWYNARKSIGSYGTIVGPVESVADLGNRVMVNIGADYPDPNRAQIVIWAERREDFRELLSAIDVEGAWVSVSGEIGEYDSVPQIDVNDTRTHWEVYDGSAAR